MDNRTAARWWIVSAVIINLAILVSALIVFWWS